MREITYAEAIREALSNEMRRDDTVFIMGEDIGIYGGAFGVTLGMIEEFGEERIRDTPISEAVITGAGAGAAMSGLRPVVEIQFSDFITLATDQLVNQAAKIRYMYGGQFSVPMTLRTPAGSGTGAASQHSQSLENWLCHIPGLKVVVPSTPYDAKGLLVSAIRDNDPVVFIEQKLLYKTKGPVPETSYTIPLSHTDVKREGTDLTLVTYGRMVPLCLQLAEEFSQQGTEIEIIDPMTLRPLDIDPIISSAKKTGKVCIVHEAVQFSGFGAEIAAQIADSEAFFYLDGPIRRLGGLDVPIPYNPILEACAVPSTNTIRDMINSLINPRRSLWPTK